MDQHAAAADGVGVVVVIVVIVVIMVMAVMVVVVVMGVVVSKACLLAMNEASYLHCTVHVPSGQIIHGGISISWGGYVALDLTVPLLLSNTRRVSVVPPPPHQPQWQW